MIVRLLCAAAALCAALALFSVTSHAAGQSFIYRGNGRTLTLSGGKAWYGSTLHGTFKAKGVTYHVEGDWIPAGDAGGDLLRFYGHALPGVKVMGLVGVATFYSTCVPNCAAAKTFQLRPIGQFSIPGSPTGKPLMLHYAGSVK